MNCSAQVQRWTAFAPRDAACRAQRGDVQLQLHSAYAILCNKEEPARRTCSDVWRFCCSEFLSSLGGDYNRLASVQAGRADDSRDTEEGRADQPPREERMRMEAAGNIEHELQCQACGRRSWQQNARCSDCEGPMQPTGRYRAPTFKPPYGGKRSSREWPPVYSISY